MERGVLGEIYNIGTSVEIPILQLARELVEMVSNIHSCVLIAHIIENLLSWKQSSLELLKQLEK